MIVQAGRGSLLTKGSPHNHFYRVELLHKKPFQIVKFMV